MKIVDRGHVYELAQLDGDGAQRLVFVKRCNPPERYPGNFDAHPGVTCQEVLRAVIDRVEYVNSQFACLETETAREHLVAALACFERRAARVHGLQLDAGDEDIVRMSVCAVCGHVVCDHRVSP